MFNVDKRMAPVLALGLTLVGLCLALGLLLSTEIARAAPGTDPSSPARLLGPTFHAALHIPAASSSGESSALEGSGVLSVMQRYVSPTGADSGTCSNPAGPCRSVQYAVDRAGAGDIVLVAAGVYTDTNEDGQVLYLSKAVVVEGGYAPPDWTAPNPAANPTILDGENSAQVLYITAGASPAVRLLHLRNGSASNGAGIYVAGGDPVLERNRIYDNAATMHGGGLYLAGGGAQVYNNLIYGNQALVKRGGGIYVGAGAARIVHNTLYDNQALERGGGIYVLSGSTAVTATIVADNSAAAGGGVYAEVSSAPLDYNNVWGNSGGDYGGLVSAGSHSTSTNPLFINASLADFRLQVTSPCIDWVPVSQTLPADFDGWPRPFRSAGDIGAHEYFGGTCFARVEAGEVLTTVQAAVDQAAGGQVVKIAGLCTGSGPDPVVHIEAPITVRGGYTITNWSRPDPDLYPTILDGQDERRVVHVGTVAAVVEGLHIRNGHAASQGAGLLVGSAPVVLRHNRVYNNVLTGDNTYGAGVFLAGGAPTVENNEIYSNTSQGNTLYGAGLYVGSAVGLFTGNRIHDNQKLPSGNTLGGGLYVAGPITLEGNEIYHNTATRGAGLAIRDGSAPSVAGNEIYSNTAEFGGGGIYVDNASPTIEDNEIYGNLQTSGGEPAGGAAIYVLEGNNVAIRRNTIHDNTSAWDGGGVEIYVWGGAQIAIERNVFYGNSAAHWGGGLWYRHESSPGSVRNNLFYANTAATGAGIGIGRYALVENNTIYGNQATSLGGGISTVNGWGVPILRNNIVVGNSPYGIYTEATIMVEYSDVWNNTAADCVGCICTGSGNISQDPLLADPAAGDLHLTAGSPCIDTAHTTSYPADDYAGWSRPFGPLADMGAYEFYSGTCFARVGSAGQVYQSPQAAVDQAGSGDEVRVAGTCEGTYTRTVASDTLYQAVFISQPLTLRGGYTLTNWLLPSSVTALDAGGAGRVVYVTGPGPVAVEGLVIRGGNAITGGGLYLAGSLPATIQNVTFHDNSAGSGAGLASAGGAPRLLNNTFAFNTATTGGGLYIAAGSPTISNTIVVSNSASSTGGGIYVVAGASPVLAYNDFWHNSGADYAGTSPGSTDWSGDPLFMDPAGRDLHLSSSSRCIHKGDPDTRVTSDLEGTARPQGRGYDAGSDEATHYPDLTLEPNTESKGIPGQYVIHQHVLTNIGTVTDTFDLSHSLTTVGVGTGWSVDYAPAVTLEPGVASLLPVTVGVPADTLSGSQAIVVLAATSRVNPDLSASVTDTTIVNWDPGVDLAPQYEEHVNPGTVLTYVHTLTNLGNAPDIFQVAASNSRGWTSVTPTLIAANPHMTSTVFVRLIVPSTMPGGLVETNIIHLHSILPGSSASDVVTNTFTVIHKPGDRYVAVGGTDNLNNCLVPSLPCRRLPYGVGQAVSGDTVKISVGTYAEYDVTLNKDIVIQGGYSANWSVLDPEAYPVYIDAQRRGRVLNLVGSPTVQGLHLVNGYINGSGGAVYIGAGAPVLRQNWLHGNEAVWRGGAIYNALGSPTIDRNRIYDNTAGVAGAGFYSAMGSPSVWNNLFYDNTTEGRGGGLATALGTPRLWHNTVMANSAQYGGGLYVGGGAPIISNTLVISNVATVEGGGIHYAAGSPATDYNNVWANAGGDYGGGLLPGSHSLSVDPLFVDAATVDLHLQMTSPCLDQGDGTVVPWDMDGGPRWVEEAPDMGADEYLQSELVHEPDQARLAYPGDRVVYSHLLTNNGNYTDTVSLVGASTHAWLDEVEGPDSLGPGQSGLVTATIEIPEGVLSGTVDTLVLTATSGLNPDVFDTAVDRTTIGPLSGVLIEPPLEGRADSSASQPVTLVYTHRLTNTGNYADTFYLTGSSEHGWNVAIVPPSVLLGMGNSIAVEVRVTAPALPPTQIYDDVTTVTARSQTYSDVSDTVTDTTILNHQPDVLLEPDYTTTGLPGQNLSFYHTVTNTGNYTDTFDLTFVTNWWANIVGPQRVTLGPAESHSFHFQVRVHPEAGCSTSVQATLTATSRSDMAVFDHAVDTIMVDTWGDAWLEPPGVENISSNPSAPIVVEYWHILRNEGNCTETFSLSAHSTYLGYVASVDPVNVTLEPGQESPVNVTVIAPPGQPSCSNLQVDVTTVSAVSQNAQASNTDTTIANQCPGLELAPDNTEVVTVPAQAVVIVDYVHVLTNTGNYYDTFTVTAVSLNGWLENVSPEEVTLAAGEQEEIAVRVRVPQTALTITDTVWVTAKSHTAPSLQASVTDTTIVARPHVSLFPDRYGNSPGGTLVTYTHTLLNDGGLVDDYTLTARNHHGWPVIVSPAVVTDLLPGANTLVTAVVSVPAGIAVGTVNTTVLTATSHLFDSVYDEAVDLTYIPQVPGALIEPACNQQADPGATVICTHTLQNTGNYTEAFYLAVHSKFAYAEIEPTAVGELAPGETFGPVVVRVYIPPYAESGQTEETEIIATFAHNDGQSATVDRTHINYVSGTRYVAVGGIDDGNNCLDLDYGPCATPQHAADQALNGDVAKLAAGVYEEVQTIDGSTQVLYLAKSLTVRGGYQTGDWTVSDPVSNLTVLDAGGQGRALLFPPTGSAPTVEGLHLTGGQASDSGGGIYIGLGTNPTLRLNAVYSNTAPNGGGLYYVGGGNPRLERNVFYHNTGQEGGALYLGSGDATVWNNAIYSNTAGTKGGGVYTIFGNPLLRNNTLYGNSAAPNGGGGIYIATGAPTIDHTILANNVNYGVFNGIGLPTLAYNLAWANSGGDGNVDLGAGSLLANPRLIDPDHADLRLRGSSPCIDAGSPSALQPADDLEGNARPLGVQRDIGAYEYKLVREKTGPAHAEAGATITYTLTITNAGQVHQGPIVVTDVLQPNVDYAGLLLYNGGSGQYDAASRTIIWTGPVYTSTPAIITFTARITDWLATGSVVTNTAWADLAQTNVFTTEIGPTPGTRYVAPAGTDTANNCRSTWKPCQTVQYALDQALDGETVKVAAGTFVDTLAAGQVASITQSVVLMGGHAPGSWLYDPEIYVTTLNGQGMAREVLVSEQVTVTLAGLRLEGAARGVQAGDATLTISRSHVYNHANDGIAVDGGKLELLASWVHDNGGDGVQISGAPYELVNNVLARNVDAGLRTLSSAGTLLHNTLAENGVAGAAIGGTAEFVNSIVYGQPVGILAPSGSNASADYTLWHANTLDTSGNVATTNDLHGDPAFVNPAAANYHIRSSSLALDTGLDVGVLTDIDGGRRPLLDGPDIGADEYPLAVIKLAPPTAAPGEVITYQISIEGTETGLVITDTLHPYLDYAGMVDCSFGECSYVAAERAIRWSGDLASPPPVIITFTAQITDWLAAGTAVPNYVTGLLGGGPIETSPVETIITSLPGTRYVTPAGDDTANSCRIVTRPCATVQYAVDQALDGDQVLVAGGNYTAPAGASCVVTISRSITLIGGLSTDDWLVRDPVAHPTRLDAGGSAAGVCVAGPAAVAVIGLEVIDAGSWGIVVDDAAFWLEGSQVQGSGGPGVLLTGSDYTLINNVVAGNSSGGLRTVASSGRLLHNTFADNAGTGARIDGAAVFSNTIVHGNEFGVVATITSTATLRHTLWHANLTERLGPVASSDDLYGDPQFVAPAAGDYHLQGDSLALENGLWVGVGEDVDRDTRPAGQAPDIGADQYPLRVARWAEPDEPAPCGVVTHTLELVNLSRAPIGGVSLSEILPPGSSYGGLFEYSTGSGAWDGVALHWAGDVAVDTPALLTFTTQIDPYLLAGVAITHTATVTDPISTFDSRPLRLTLRPLDVTFGKLAPAMATIGETVNYTLRHVVPGGHVTYEPTLVDHLPGPALSYVPDSGSPPPQAIAPDGTITWTLPTNSAACADPQTVDVTFAARVEDLPGNVAGQVLVNSGTLTYTEAAHGLAHVVNAGHALTLIEPVPVLNKSVMPGSGLGVGDLVYVTLAISNTGLSPLYDGVLTDTLPDELALVGGSAGYALYGQTVSWTLASLAPGNSATYSITAQVKPGVEPGTALTNHAALAGTSLPGPAAVERGYRATDEATLYIGFPDLVVTKHRGPEVLSPGLPITYTIFYTNAGVIPAATVQIVDLLPPLVTDIVSDTSRPASVDVAGQAITWTLLSALQPGEAGTIWITGLLSLAAQDGTVLLNTAIITSTTAEAALANNVDTVSITVRRPALAITKVAQPPTVLPGGLLDYTLTVHNSGLGAATELLVTDAVPAGTSFQACSGGDSCSLAGGVVTWSIAVLAAGQSVDLGLAVQVDGDAAYGSSIVNATYGVTCLQGETAQGAPVGVPVGASGVLRLEPDQSASGKRGQAVIYHHTLTNDTNTTQTIQLEAVSSQGWAVSVAPGTIELDAGASGAVAVTVTIAGGAPTGAVDLTVVTATGTLWGSDSATDTTTVGGNYVYLPVVVRRY